MAIEPRFKFAPEISSEKTTQWRNPIKDVDDFGSDSLS